MNRLCGSNNDSPNESNTRWDYFLPEDPFPQLSRGDVVLVSYYGKNRIAVVGSKIPGGIFWGTFGAPVNGATRVIVSRHSLVGVRVGTV
jgi:hypothetical protein